jgi:hypothetical protein
MGEENSGMFQQSKILLTGLLLTLSAHAANPAPEAGTSPPALACYFVHEPDLDSAVHQAFLERTATGGRFTHLTTSLRLAQGELTDKPIHEAIRSIAERGAALGLGIVMDLDVRLARDAFQAAHPGELQEMLRLRELPRTHETVTQFAFTAEIPSDHYTFKAKPYLPVASRLVRVYAYARGPEGIDPASVTDITAACVITAQTEASLGVEVPAAATSLPLVCALVAFTHLTPDVYAAHLLSFQRELLDAYANLGLAGACKDEWGFPPSFDGLPRHDDFWYSEAMAAAYRDRTGRDLVRDVLLMHAGEHGRTADRLGAINHYMEMNRQRHVAIEADFYNAVKETFGSTALVATHPTWYPQLDRREIKKNGLSWWAAPRDYAQTDEVTPFCVRTALAKKWNNSVWYNMYYSGQMGDYERSLWSHALAGGRINYHPLYPVEATPPWTMDALYEGGLMQGEARVRLLNLIAPAPLDCPVAVIFGHAAAMNWAGGSYEDTGLEAANALWRLGHYADLIPSSEIASGALRMEGGQLVYGTQRYRAALLYRPEFEGASTATWLEKARPDATRLFSMGAWTRGFDGNPFNGNAHLEQFTTRCPSAEDAVAQIIACLGKEDGPWTPASETLGWDQKSASLPASGQVRLLDGTRVITAGTNDPAGDPIQTTLEVNGHAVRLDAIGVAAVRLAADGGVQALAAGGLKSFETPDLAIELAVRLNLAIWRDAAGMLHGAVETTGPLPEVLTRITPHWTRLGARIP